MENCNLAVDLGVKLGLSLTGIGGVDIYNKNNKLVLGACRRFFYIIL